MRKALDFLAVAAILSAVAAYSHETIGAIEGRLFPVVSVASIASVEPVDAFHSRVRGTFEKRRDCLLTGMEWDVGGTFLPFRFEESVDRAPDGSTFEFGPISLSIPAAQIGMARSVVTHRCHPLWDTRTVFFEPA